MSLFSGQGPVFHSNRNASGEPTYFEWFGNAPEFTLALATETLTHKESYSGNRVTDARIITETTANMSITVDDFKEANLELALYGQGSQITSGTATDEAVWDSAPRVGDKYAFKNTGRVTITNVKSAGVAVNTSMYSVDASGILTFTDVTGLNGPITATYTYAASRQVGAFKTTAPEKYIRLASLNTAEATDAGDFERALVDVFKWRGDPAENIGLVNDEFGTLTLNGSALVDPLHSASSGGGQFMRIIYLDPPSQTVASASASPSSSASPSVSPSVSPS